MGPIGSAPSPAELTRLLLGNAAQQTTEMAKKLVAVNTQAAVQGAARQGVGQVLDALA